MITFNDEHNSLGHSPIIILRKYLQNVLWKCLKYWLIKKVVGNVGIKCPTMLRLCEKYGKKNLKYKLLADNCFT